MDYFLFESIPDTKILDSIIQLHESIFHSSNNLVKQMESKPKLLINLAAHDMKVVGYKIEYELDTDKMKL